uniref:DUF1907 domain-containing protein n=1 Tax=Syphacia muris TaxID=451379 RepID=A0A0N5AJK7_9BILA
MENHSNPLFSKVTTLVPPLNDFGKAIQEYMKKNFSGVFVEVVPECPDIGGNAHLCPVPRPDIYYKLEFSKGFMFGPGAGPCYVIGVNSEMVADASFSEAPENVAIKVGFTSGKKEVGCKMMITDKPEFCILGNLAIRKIRAFGRLSNVALTEQYFELDSPVVCTTVIHIRDVNQCNLRLDYTHCYTDSNAGQFYGDTEPERMEYVDYFVIAEAVYRIDKV